jgi:hypothetical protein
VTILWDYYWPVAVLGLVIGMITGSYLYNRIVVDARNQIAGVDSPADDRQGRRKNIFYAGLAGTLVIAALWHAAFGAGDRLAARIEAAARAELQHQEMTGVTARLERSPLRRRLVLSGPADDFQQTELVRIMDEIPGVSGVRWASPPAASSESVK